MRDRILGGRRNPLLHYGVLVVLIIVLFGLGIRLGQLLMDAGRQPTANVPASGGTALVQPPQLVQDFTLTDHSGQRLSLSDLRGKPVLLFFGYTQCPEECPLTLLNYKRIKGELGDAVQYVFVSVDGERDTPQVMADYLRKFDADFIGMTSSPDDLRQLGTQFGLVFENVVFGSDGSQQPATAQDENYFVSHISPTFLIDKDGYLNRLYFYGTEPEAIAANLREFLNAA
jgi:protein SCO1/2